MNAKSLEGKVAIITGARRGMGAKISRTFAQNGAAVILNDIVADGASKVAKDIIDSGG